MKRMITNRRGVLAGIGGAMAASLISNKAMAGSLEPPGPPSPTGASTGQLASMIARPFGVSEPRMPLTGQPGTTSSLYEISSAGSYCMTENLVVPTGMNGLLISGDNVDLDMQGFHMLGSGGGTPGDFSVAISVTGQNVCISDGSIEGWAVGVQVDGPKFLLWDLTVLGCTIAGFRLNSDGQAYDCDVYTCPVGFDMHGVRSMAEECSAWSCPVSFQCNGSQNLIIGNTATDSQSPFAIGPGNSFGPIVVVTGVGNIGAVAGSNHFLCNLVY